MRTLCLLGVSDARGDHKGMADYLDYFVGRSIGRGSADTMSMLVPHMVVERRFWQDVRPWKTAWQIASTTDDQNQPVAFADALNKMVNAHGQDNLEVLQRSGDDPHFRDAFGSWMFRIRQNRIAVGS